MIPFSMRVFSSILWYNRGFCSLYSAAPSSKSSWYFAEPNNKRNWDPTVSLTLRHPTILLLEKCRSHEHFKQILANMIRLHLTSQTFPMSRLLYFSAISHPENLNIAILLFNHLTQCPNLYIYRIMIQALSFSPVQSFAIYNSMLVSGICPDEHTLISLLKSSEYFSLGRQIHAHAILVGLTSHAYLQNSLMKMYMGNGELDLAQQVFQYIPQKDIVSYNIMISGLSEKEYVLQALELFREAVFSVGIEPDQYSMVALLKCCKQLKSVLSGKSIHGWMLRKYPICTWGLVLNNALLDMYAKCEYMKIALQLFNGLEEKDCFSWNIIIAGFANIGELDLAFNVFCATPSRDLVSWNSMLAGYVQKGDTHAVINLFGEMLSEGFEPDKMTAITLVCTAADMGSLSRARCTHVWAIKTHGIIDAFLGSAIIDMYCKCGSIEKALVTFKMMSHKDVTVCTSMITGLAFHGHGTKALEFFWQMQKHGLMPNYVTFIAILTACSHTGLVDQGYRIFKEMNRSYGIEAGVEHYGCLVDLLARSGRLTEALDVVERMPMKPSRSIWGAILSAGNSHGNMEIAEVALRKLLVLEPEDEGGYILMSNAYAALGKWNCSDKIRETMGKTGVRKVAGCSSIVFNRVVHDFVSSDKKHLECDEIYFTLCNLNIEMRSGVEPPSDLQQLANIHYLC